MSSSSLSRLSADLGALAGDAATADVLLLVGSEPPARHHAHRLVLWARCSAFQAYEHQFWRSRPSLGPLTFQYPQYDPAVFSDVITYVYSAQISLTDRSVFPALTIARDLGVPSLVAACVAHVQAALSPNNACTFLQQAWDAEDTAATERLATPLVRSCLAYICQHAAKCVLTPAWRHLPKAAVTALVSSQQFSVEEECVWRAVMCWARAQAGVGEDVTRWSAGDRDRIAQALDGVVEHVKFLLIDSKVYAEEVEPTGMVPMELSLERYRSAAVHHDSLDSDDLRLQPRVCFRYFPDSLILGREKLQYQRLLNSWCGRARQTWRLLYRGSRDGFSAAAFHARCDGRAPTIVLVQGPKDQVCGGFSDVPWSSPGGGGAAGDRGRFVPSHRTFLFTLVNNQDVAPTKFPVTNSKYATVHHPEFGPMFGAGADLCIADHADAGMESYSNLPHSYGGSGASQTILMGDYNFSVTDYEVFTTEQAAGAGESEM